MTYDWTKHTSTATIEGRAVEGGGGPAGAVVKTQQPKGFVKLNSGVSFVIDSLSYFERDERVFIEDLLEYICDLDKEFPFLTWYNRRGIQQELTTAQRNCAFDEE